MGRRGYPPEFRRKVLDLIDAGRKVRDVARDLGISEQTIYVWRKQHRIDQGLEPGLSSGERAELVAARRRIVRLETELKIARRAAELLKDAKPPKDRFAAIDTMAAEGLPVQTSCRMLEVSESGFYAWRSRPPSERQIRHAWLTDLITEIHVASRQTYGSIRVHAELTLGRGIDVGRHQVELVMRRAGLRGIVGRRKRPRIERPDAIALDLVDRSFVRSAPDELWVTDITEHPTREGKVYCAVVLDTFSRRVVGWSIDSSPTAALVTNALGMAIDARDPRGTLIHSDQGTQGEINRSSQHLDRGGAAWDDREVGRRRRRGGHRCVHRDGRRGGVVSIDRASGTRSRRVPAVRSPQRLSGCRPPLVSDGSVRVAGCEQSPVFRFQAGISPSPNARRSPSSTRRGKVSARSLVA